MLTIRIHNVPDALYRRLRARAELAGMSLSDYLMGEIRKITEQPTIKESRALLNELSPVKLSVDPAKAVRADRDGR